MPIERYNPSEDSPYRFIDNVNDVESSAIATTPPPAVEFYPAIEDYVDFAEINSNRFPPPSLARFSMQTFLLLNVIGLPAILFLFDFGPLALAVFVLNVALSSFIIPNMLKVDLRRFYNAVSPELENTLLRVELRPDGLVSASGEARSFFSWKSVSAIDETKNAIIFTLNGGQGIAVRKTGFAYEGDIRAFFTYANERLNSIMHPHEPNRS